MSNYPATKPQVNISPKEAIAVRDLAMSLLRPLANRELSSRAKSVKKRGFVLYSDSGQTIGSGAIDRYLGIVVSKQPSRAWCMKISFLEYILTEEARYSNFREVFDFECQQNVGCTALRKTIVVDAPIISSRTDLETKAIIDTVVPNRLESIEPMDTSDCDVLCGKMLEFYRQELTGTKNG